ncbi:Lrp/AsnC family transcriptional regulator [Candidatus Woesearchaeota archaeon]|nr:Lrp/AsnC family transcriptional regulator [Candidatus Woesearchaeota archaeon]
MIKKRDFIIMSYLRKNGRETLTSLSKKTSIPISSIFDKAREYQANIVSRNTVIADFTYFGYHVRAHVALKSHTETKERLLECLLKHLNVNSVYKINNGYDFLMEGIFKNIKDLEEFLDYITVTYRIRAKEIHYIIEDLKREQFMADPSLVELLI